MDISEFKNLIWDYTRKINENISNIFNPVCVQYGLTMMQVRILMELYKYESHTIGSLAQGICVAGTNISSMCKKLENIGLLERARDQYDERVVKVGLSKKGKEIVLEMDTLLIEKISQNIGDETEDTFKDIIKGLQKLDDLLQRVI